jgi:hypothetical protein
MNTKTTTALLAATLHIAGLGERIKARYVRAARGEEGDGLGVGTVLMIIIVIGVCTLIGGALTLYLTGKIQQWK